MIDSDISYDEYSSLIHEEKEEDIHKHNKIASMDDHRLFLMRLLNLYSHSKNLEDITSWFAATEEMSPIWKSPEKHSLELNEKSDVETRLERLESSVEIHMKQIRELTSKNIELSKKIDILEKADLRHTKPDDDNKGDVEFLTSLFELSGSCSNGDTGDALSEMKGMLDEYAVPCTDSVSMIRSLRNEQ